MGVLLVTEMHRMCILAALPPRARISSDFRARDPHVKIMQSERCSLTLHQARGFSGGGAAVTSLRALAPHSSSLQRPPSATLLRCSPTTATLLGFPQRMQVRRCSLDPLRLHTLN